MDSFADKDEVRLSQKRRNRWEQPPDGVDEAAGAKKKAKTTSDWDLPDATLSVAMGRRNRWDETPTNPMVDSDATPTLSGTPRRQRSRWDETPKAAVAAALTPFGGAELATPTPGAMKAIMPEQNNLFGWDKEIEERNMPLTDEQLDAMFPQQGYKILKPPASYKPIRTPARKLLATPTPDGTPFYMIPVENRGQMFDVPKELPDGLHMNPNDYQFFGALMNEEDNEELSAEEQKDRKIMKLLLKVKNGTPQQRKAALRQLTEKALEFGAGPLFDRILPLLMQPKLQEQDQERHLLVKEHYC